MCVWVRERERQREMHIAQRWHLYQQLQLKKAHRILGNRPYRKEMLARTPASPLRHAAARLLAATAEPASAALGLPKIAVVGVGGGGGNAVNAMALAGVPGVELFAANTDAQALALSLAPPDHRLQLGGSLTGGLGAGECVRGAKPHTRF